MIHVDSGSALPKLEYRAGDAFAPIPPAERGLQTVEARLFAEVPLPSDAPANMSILEGLAFNHAGNLYFSNPPMGRIYELNMETRETALICQLPEGWQPTAVKLHRDGRLFVTCIVFGEGSFVAVISPEGEVLAKVAESALHYFDDLVFDMQGGFYLSDLSGSPAEPTGGVWYVAPGRNEPSCVVTGMVGTNGIALSPQGDALWVTEYGAGKLHHFKIDSQHRIPRFASSHVPYYFTGLEGADSACIDADGNVYVAMCGQGRFLVFNSNGMPIGQVLLPGRDEGSMLMSTHPQLRPGTDELYLCSADKRTGKAGIFVARGFAAAHLGFAFS